MGEKLKKNEKLKNGVNFEELEKRNTKIRAELKYHVKIHKESVKLVEGARFSLFFYRWVPAKGTHYWKVECWRI